MKTTFVALLFASFLSLNVKAECRNQYKMFTNYHSQIGDSNVEYIAFKKAAAEAEKEGFTCPSNYYSGIEKSNLIRDYFSAIVQVECAKELCRTK